MANTGKRHDIYEGEGETVQLKLEEPDVNVGDTIKLNTNNQMGVKEWEVILDKNGNKATKLIYSYDDVYEGGKRRRHRRKSNKRRTHRRKSKRRTRRRMRK